jgi:hypothetical protein
MPRIDGLAVMSTADRRSFSYPFPEYVDWLAAAFVALTGLAFAAGGSVLFAVADRELLAADIGAGELRMVLVERTLTEAESLTFATALVNWTGIGLLVTGLGLVVFAVGFGVGRHRSHRERDADTGDSPRTRAVFGAVATTLLSFLPLSPVFGGGFAAYLGRETSENGATVGALSGLFAVVPALSVLGFVTVGVVTGLSKVEATEFGLFAVAAMAFLALFVALYGAGFGALGGVLGARLTDRD